MARRSRSTETQICPALANAPERRLLRRPARVDARVDDQRVVAAVLQQRPSRRSARTRARSPGRSRSSRRARRRRRRRRPARRPPCRRRRGSPARPRAGAAASSSANRRPVCGQRSLGLCTTVLPVTSAAPSRPAGDGDRVVPRGQHGDDAARAGHHQVGGVPAAVQAAAPVHGPQLGVLPQRADAGVDPAARVVERLAHLALGVRAASSSAAVPHGRRGGVQRGGPFGGRGVGPAVGGERGPGAGPARPRARWRSGRARRSRRCAGPAR